MGEGAALLRTPVRRGRVTVTALVMVIEDASRHGKSSKVFASRILGFTISAKKCVIFKM